LLPIKAAQAAVPKVGFKLITVCECPDSDRLLTLHCCRSACSSSARA
jgi:hypothetical protein